MQIIYQNEALGISFLEKLVTRSSKVTQGLKSQKGKISILFKSRQIITQNEALELSFSKKLVSRSFEVNSGQNREKRSNFNLFQAGVGNGTGIDFWTRRQIVKKS